MIAVLAALALLGALIGLLVVGLRYRAEQREGARVRALFSRYVAPPIVEELLRRKDPRLYTGRSVYATVLVCRIWNFAGFAETLTAQETLRYLNEFFALAGTTIQKHRGMIDKFLSDGIIGVFGVPLEDPAAEDHALRAALDIVRLVDAMDRSWRAQGRRSFQVGIGINSGEVIAGDAGFNERREFTVVGPQTLFAGRLQEATFELRASVVADATTCGPVRHLFSLVPLTGHPLPGLKRLADAFIVLGRLHESDDPLTMPGAHSFRQTQITASEDARQAAPAGAASPSSATLPAPLGLYSRFSPPPPDLPIMPRIERPDPLAPLQRRRPRDVTFAPQARLPPHFNTAADGPIMPDPPGPRNVYEDGSGPPIPFSP
jgi:class 3 adenylate cyclase